VTMTSGQISRGGQGRRTKGEVNEIRKTINHLCSLDGRKPEVVQSKRECFQKIIKYMAIIDMSSLFVPVMKCSALSKQDLPLKKMLYLYLRSSARQNSSVSLLVVQTFLNDTKDVDPRIRGLAVRSMCSLRVPELLESVFPVVSQGLQDPNAYVREVSVIGVLKCYRQDEEKTVALGLIDEVKNMLNTDRDTQVLTSCLYVLQELKALRSIPRQRMISFMNNIKSFSEWGQCLLMQVLLEHYRPETESERFDVLEVLDFGLNHTNSAVILSTAKLFLHYTANYKEQYDQVIRLILGPVRTLIMGREPEVAYAVLCNVQVLAQRHPHYFRIMTHDLFYRPDDQPYVKIAKLDLMVVLSHPDNAFDTAEEVFEYSKDFNDDIARHAIACVAKIAIHVGSVDGILDRLLLFLNHRRQVLVAETVNAFAAALTKFPSAADICVPSIAKVDHTMIESVEGRVSFIWILGQFGSLVQDAPYLLEDVCEEYDMQDNAVKQALLTSIVQLFCSRPPECLCILKKILESAMNDGDPILQEKAALYANLLESLGKDGTREMIKFPSTLGPADEIQSFSDLQDILFDEWNSLSVVYGEPASTFIEGGVLKRSFSSDSLGGGESLPNELDNIGTDSLIEVDLPGGGPLHGDNDFSFDISPQAPLPQSSQSHMNFQTKSTTDLDLLLTGEPLDHQEATNAARGHLQEHHLVQEAGSFELRDVQEVQIDQNKFKLLWNDMEIYSNTFSSELDSAAAAEVVSTFDQHIEQANLKCVGKPVQASNSLQNRFFFYGVDKRTETPVLVCVSIASACATADVRSENADLAAYTRETLETLLCVL
jgi:vesicle coat complex subunit